MVVREMVPLFSFRFRQLINLKIPLGIKGNGFLVGHSLKGTGSQAPAPSLKNLSCTGTKGGLLFGGQYLLEGMGSQAPALPF